MAIYYAYRILGKIGDLNKNETNLFIQVEAATENIQSCGNDLSLYMGSPGVAWVLDHLQEIGLTDATEDLNEDIDAAIVASLTRRPSGFAGVAAAV
jgi:hypothetical protein